MAAGVVDPLGFLAELRWLGVAASSLGLLVSVLQSAEVVVLRVEAFARLGCLCLGGLLMEMAMHDAGASWWSQ